MALENRRQKGPVCRLNAVVWSPGAQVPEMIEDLGPKCFSSAQLSGLPTPPQRLKAAQGHHVGNEQVGDRLLVLLVALELFFIHQFKPGNLADGLGKPAY
jgi:hypothetical protein